MAKLTFSCSPSMHEDAGWVVAEAGSSRLPVVPLDRGGPPLLGAVVATPGTLDETIERMASCATSVTKERRAVADFDLDTRTAQLQEMLLRRELLSATPVTGISHG
jgi:hypothetical protein